MIWGIVSSFGFVERFSLSPHGQARGYLSETN